MVYTVLENGRPCKVNLDIARMYALKNVRKVTGTVYNTYIAYQDAIAKGEIKSDGPEVKAFKEILDKVVTKEAEVQPVKKTRKPRKTKN